MFIFSAKSELTFHFQMAPFFQFLSDDVLIFFLCGDAAFKGDLNGDLTNFWGVDMGDEYNFLLVVVLDFLLVMVVLVSVNEDLWYLFLCKESLDFFLVMAWK